MLNDVRDNEMSKLAIICVALHVLRDIERRYWVVQRRLIQHADRCLRVVRDEPPIIETNEWALYRLGIVYKVQGRLSDAEAMFERALRGYEETLGPEHKSTLNIVGNLGLLYVKQGRLSDAESIYERVLQGMENGLGRGDTSTLNTVHNLGILYELQGQLSDAEATYERAFRGFEKALGPEHTSTLNTVHNLGILYKHQGRLRDTEAIYKRVLRCYEKALGLEHESTLHIVYNLGILHSSGPAKRGYIRAGAPSLRKSTRTGTQVDAGYYL